MFRRTFLAGLAGGAFAARAAPIAKTNFVFILADDFGWKDLACYGNPYFATPNIDRLAREGAKFTNAYAACPVCSPTRASILTGRYPVRTGVTDWIPGRPFHEKGPITAPRTATELKPRGDDHRGTAQTGRIPERECRQVAPGQPGVLAHRSGLRREHRRQSKRQPAAES